MALLPRPVVIAIASVVIGVWAVSQIAVIFVAGYEPPAELHLVVMAVLAVAFGLQRGDRPSPPDPNPDPELPEQPEPQLPDGRESAAELIARLQRERRSGGA